MKKKTYRVGSSSLTLEFGDITTSDADVLVSSDDSYLTMSGGVSAAIRNAGGETIMVDAAKSVPAELGDVIVTAAGLLPAKHVFHAVTIGDGQLRQQEVVARTTGRCFDLLETLRLRSIAFPAIGAGVARFSVSEVAAQMAEVIAERLARSPHSFEVSIYLLDRFQRMQPIDYVDFFEQVTLRTSKSAPALVPAVTDGAGSRSTDGVKVPSGVTQSKREEHAELVRQLGRLEGERQLLEARMAQVGGLPADEEQEIEKRLQDVHRERVQTLALVNREGGGGSARVFISYSHADEAEKSMLRKHLRTLERNGLIGTWQDRMIGAGSEWEGVIHEELEKADVILLLISADFIDSKYCFDVEMTRALARHEKREALVIPVMLRPVLLDGLPFAKLQALPRDARPVTEWPSRDAAFKNITEGIRDAVSEFAGRSLRKLPGSDSSPQL